MEPDFLQHERAWWTAGHVWVAGTDEAGRGCLAGPVVAAAVVFPQDIVLEGVADSKSLSRRQRETLAERIQEAAQAYAIGFCSPAEIDQLNILWASMKAMRRAIEALSTPPSAVLVDGNRVIPQFPLPIRAIVKGDAQSHCIAAASILAKVTRDAWMTELDAAFPAYGFARHKGYPTAEHYTAIEKWGVTPHHRRSFKLFRQSETPQITLF